VVAKDGNGLVAISCPTAGFCLAVDKAGDAITLSNGSWSSPVYVDARSGVFTAVSCPQTTFCMAADSGGNAFAYTGGSQAWQPFTVDTSGGGLTGVSCTSSSYCVAVDTGGGAYTYDGTSWSTAVAVDVGHAFTAVSVREPVVLRRDRRQRQRRNPGRRPVGREGDGHHRRRAVVPGRRVLHRDRRVGRRGRLHRRRLVAGHQDRRAAGHRHPELPGPRRLHGHGPRRQRPLLRAPAIGLTGRHREILARWPRDW
jgi:hypothetical protein